MENIIIPEEIKNRYRLNEKDKKQEIFDMEDPSSWPNFPLLPMKNVYWRAIDHSLPWSAIMMATGDEKGIYKRIYLVNMFDLKDRGLKSSQDVKEKVEYLEYSTWDELIDAGWRVD